MLFLPALCSIDMQARDYELDVSVQGPRLCWVVAERGWVGRSTGLATAMRGCGPCCWHAALLPPDFYLQRALYFFTCRSNST